MKIMAHKQFPFQFPPFSLLQKQVTQIILNKTFPPSPPPPTPSSNYLSTSPLSLWVTPVRTLSAKEKTCVATKRGRNPLIPPKFPPPCHFFLNPFLTINGDVTPLLLLLLLFRRGNGEEKSLQTDEHTRECFPPPHTLHFTATFLRGRGGGLKKMKMDFPRRVA